MMMQYLHSNHRHHGAFGHDLVILIPTVRVYGESFCCSLWKGSRAYDVSHEMFWKQHKSNYVNFNKMYEELNVMFPTVSNVKRM